MLLVVCALLVLGAHGARDLQNSEIVNVQVIVRHGSKVPDMIDPFVSEIWDSYAPVRPGQTSPLGLVQFRTLGNLLRQRYVFDEPLLPQEFDQNTVRIRSSSLNDRPLVSIQALTETLYPGAAIPVFTEDPEEDTLLCAVVNCPSYVAGVKSRTERALIEWDRLYPDLFANLKRVVGYAATPIVLPPVLDPTAQCTWDECTDTGLFWLAEEIMCRVDEGFDAYNDPYLKQQEELILGIWADLEMAWFGMEGPEDPRGPSWGAMGREILQNMANAISGDSDEVLQIYPVHSLFIVQLFDLFNLGTMVPWYGEGLLFELRRDLSTGEYFVRAENVFPDPGGFSYSAVLEPLKCPSLQDRCSYDDFLGYMGTRAALPADDEGCCHVGEDFFLLGCDDFLNPATVEIPECLLYRKWCPQVSCGDGQVVDAATFLCVEVVEEEEQ